MIDALDLPDALQRPVLQFGPDAAHLLDLDAAGLRGIENPRLGGEPLGFKLPGGGQDVRMMVALVALAVRRMDRHIDGHAVAADQLLREVADDPRPLGRADLGRQGQLPFAPGDGVAAGLAGLGGVPERGPVLRPGGGMLGRDDERLLDALLAGVVVQTALALALDALARAVGGGGGDGASGGPFDRLDGEVVAGHAPYPPADDGRCRSARPHRRRAPLLTPANAPTLATGSAVFSPEARAPQRRGRRGKDSPNEGVRRIAEARACP